MRLADINNVVLGLCLLARQQTCVVGYVLATMLSLKTNVALALISRFKVKDLTTFTIYDR